MCTTWTFSWPISSLTLLSRLNKRFFHTTFAANTTTCNWMLEYLCTGAVHYDASAYLLCATLSIISAFDGLMVRQCSEWDQLYAFSQRFGNQIKAQTGNSLILATTYSPWIDFIEFDLFPSTDWALISNSHLITYKVPTSIDMKNKNRDT